MIGPPVLIPAAGPGTLPMCDAATHPNLILVFLDAQYDYLCGRVCALSALIVAHEGGIPARQRHVVHVAGTPPATPGDEEALVGAFLAELLAVVPALATPDEQGGRRAPIHLVYWDRLRTLLLEALERCFTAITVAAPALFDYILQTTAMDGAPVATCLADEMGRFNHPLTCPSLQSSASCFGYVWDSACRDVFRENHFDATGRIDYEFYVRRARFSSQLPLEYFYSAWDALPARKSGQRDIFKPYRRATVPLLERLLRDRLDAMAHIVARWNMRGCVNTRLHKTPFCLPDLSTFQDHAPDLADALREFLLVERVQALGGWRQARLAPPEQRVLAGETLLVSYHEADQDKTIRSRNHENRQKHARGERWEQEGLCVRLRVAMAGVDCDLQQALFVTGFVPGERVVICPRRVCDERLPPNERKWRTPTPAQMLHGARAEIVRVDVERDGAGEAVAASVLLDTKSCPACDHRYLFSSAGARPFVDDEVYTLDADANDGYGQQQAAVVRELQNILSGAGAGYHTLYHRLAALFDVANGGHADMISATSILQPVNWPAAAREAQARFCEGLVAAHERGWISEELEEADRAYIGAHGHEPILHVQGPPGSGKSTKSAWAVLARLQGAMAAGRELRVYLCAGTHDATDVMVAKVVEARSKLRRIRENDSALFGRYFDARLLDFPVFRAAAAPSAPPTDGLDGVVLLPKNENKGTRERASNADRVREHAWAVVGATPGGVYGLFRDRWNRKTFHKKAHCGLLVLDETSRMSLPESLLAALPLHPAGQVLVVGDHRQLGPITQHQWQGKEPQRRTFQSYQTYRSLFDTLRLLSPARAAVPQIKFSRSYRNHKTIAAFLQHGWYVHDGIDYHSCETAVLPAVAHTDPFVAAALRPECPLVLVLHDEQSSQKSNAFEAHVLLAPLIAALTDPATYGLDATTGLGVVVPHRDQRALIQSGHPQIAGCVNTVEKYQGAEREVILIGATESDPAYLHEAGQFLMDPGRLCVALSRAKRKVVLIASRRVFSIPVTDDATFAAAALWQDLLRRSCTRRLWQGTRGGHEVTVWGNEDV